MIPFPGESVLIEDAVDLTGGGEVYDLWGTIVRRAGTRSMTTGTTWRAWAYQGDADYLEESGLDCEVSWVVEVASGTVTFTVGELLDPTYNDIASPTTPLGTFTATGPATVVIPSGFTADDVLTGGDALLFEIVCDSGSAEVQQVKLRVWPAAGVLGGWSDPQPEWSTDPELPGGYEAQITVLVNENSTTQEDSWDLTMNQAITVWESEKLGPHEFTSMDTTPGYVAPTIGGSLRAEHLSGDLGVTWGTNTVLLGAILVLGGRDWRTVAAIAPSLVDGVDYIRPPTEVRFEAGAYMAQQIGDGSTAWVNTAAYVVSSAEATPVDDPTLTATSTDDLTITALGGGLFEIDLDGEVGDPLTTPPPEGSFSESVPLPDTGRFIIVKLAHTAALIAPDWPNPPSLAGAAGGVVGFGTNPIDVDFHPLMTYATLPPYRVWVPAVARTIPLRQLHRDDGLGGTPPRAYGGASRIRTGRANGYD